MNESVMLPGAVGISRLCVYDTTGSPHIHLACGEAYVVVGGRGGVQILSSAGYAEYDLQAGTVLWFTPGTVHRLINGGDLEIIVIMANSGLPEAGDAVLTFSPEILADPDRYAAAAAQPGDIDVAHRRRDLAIDGFEVLRSGGSDALAEFYRAAVALKQPQLDGWRKIWESGPQLAAARTGDQLGALARGDIGHLTEATVATMREPTERGRLGMCGLLDTYRP
jgi:mannose-6-phosphate isomerase-like protein (cupin superfamily)